MFYCKQIAFGEITGASSTAFTLKTYDGRATRRVHSAVLGDVIKDAEFLQGFYAATSSGGPPSGKDAQIVAEMRQTLFKISEQKRNEYESLLTQITKLAAQLNRVESEHRLTLDYRRTCTRLIHDRDFRMLPTEVVSQIFQHTIPHSPHPDPNEAPLLLCRVSYTWRAVAQTLPTLWTDIWLPCALGQSRRRPLTSARPALLHNLKTWIANCGKALLSLSLSINTTDDIKWLGTVLPTIDHPIGGLSVHSRGGAPSDERLEFLRPTFIPTHSDTINTISLFNPHSGSTMLAFLNSFPNLRHLCLGTSFYPALSPQEALWPTLTTLEITSHLYPIDTPLFRGILSRCLKLQSGTFAVNSTSESARAPLPRILTLPELRILRLDIRGEAFIPDVLQGFYFPNLHSLEVKGTWPYLTWHDVGPEGTAPSSTISHPFDPLFSSLFNLDSLPLHNVSISSFSLAKILHSNPSLPHFDLHLPYDTDHTLVSLFETISANPTPEPGVHKVEQPILRPGVERTICLGVEVRQVPPMIPLARSLLVSSQAADETYESRQGFPSLRIIFSVYFPIGERHRFMEQMEGLQGVVHEAMDQINRGNWSRYLQVQFGGFVRMVATQNST